MNEIALFKSAVKLAKAKGFSILQDWQAQHSGHPPMHKPPSSGGFDIVRQWQSEHGGKPIEEPAGGFDILQEWQKKHRKKQNKKKK